MTTTTTTTEDKQPDMRQLASDIAGFMPAWQVGHNDPTNSSVNWSRVQHCETGAEISLSYKTWPKPAHIHIHGVWPMRSEHGPYGEFIPKDAKPFTCNVSATKTAEQIAKDILRRIAPAFLVEYAVQLARLRETLAGEAGAKGDAARIAAAIPGGKSRSQNGRDDSYRVDTSLFTKRRGYATIDVSPGDPTYVNVELRGLTPDEAIGVLGTLKPDSSAVSIHWVLNHLAGMKYPGQGEAYESIKRAWEAQKANGPR